MTHRKARFLLDLWLDAAAPTNVPWLNPTVVKEVVDTGGFNLARGFSNFVRDVARNGGLPSQVDRKALALGRDLAATPGRVVLRNDLIELIAYEPQTESVFAQPIVYSPPWINKYYVLDLAPGRSFIEHAVGRGFTVFAISYRNPDASMADLTMDDYLRLGWLTAVDRAAELTGAERVNVLGVCLGGTLTAIGLAVLAARGEAGRVGWATLVNALVDFSDPGDIGVFTDEATVQKIERRTARRGYLKPSELSGPFTWMRANDLVWRYVISGWYLGSRPPAFDILAWNDDATRLPAAMHTQYLRSCYVENLLTRPGGFVADGMPVDIGAIKTPLYVLGAENDQRGRLVVVDVRRTRRQAVDAGKVAAVLLLRDPAGEFVDRLDHRAEARREDQPPRRATSRDLRCVGHPRDGCSTQKSVVTGVVYVAQESGRSRIACAFPVPRQRRPRVVADIASTQEAAVQSVARLGAHAPMQRA